MIKISVVLATMNRLETLKEGLDSILNQDFPQNEYEVLVTDDGSNDGTREFLKNISANSKIKFSYHFQEHAGPAKARNWGIFHAEGDVVLFTDDDCVPPRDWLKSIWDAFERYPKVVGVSGYQEADESTISSNIYAQYEKYANMGDYMIDQQKEHVGGKDFLGGATNNVAYKREVLLEVNGFDETFPFAAAEDADLKERIVDKDYLMVHVPVKVVHKHPYGFKRLMRQAYVRGVGSRHFNKKHNRPSSVYRFGLSVGKVTLRLFFELLFKHSRLIPLVFLYQLQFMRGVVDYYRVVE